MTLVLTCALCAAQPALPSGPVDPGRFHLLEERLTLNELQAAPLPPPSALPLVPGRLPEEGSGDDGGGHSDHMGPMWIVMGVMMAVMVAGMAVYGVRHGAGTLQPQAAALQARSQGALPPAVGRGGGG